MRWGAHEVDGKLAAKNAVKIQAALRQTIDAKELYQAFLDTHPYASDDSRHDRVKARSWAILHARFNNEPIKAVLRMVWAEGYVTGRLSAVEHIYNAVKIQKAGVTGYVDWQHWTPGSQARAALVSPKGSLKTILDNANVTVKGLDSVGYDRLGKALADSFQLGLSPSKSAKLIQDVIADPSRALSIAITEGSRSANMAAKDIYQQAGITQWEWIGADPCPEECEQNDGEIVTIGEPFSNGDEHPPAHPNCRCTVGSVPPDYPDNTDSTGSTDSTDSGNGWSLPILAGILSGFSSNSTSEADDAWNELDGFFDE